MKFVLYAAAAAGLCSAATADTINYNGLVYETVDWTSSSSATNTATGTAGGVGVTFETVDIASDSIISSDFSGDAGFDALGFSDGVLESISIMGGMVGLSNLSFDQTVGSILIIVGSPNDGAFASQYGAAIWDFEDGLTMNMVDNEGNPGLTLDAGNLLSNAIAAGEGTHQSGVIGILGDMTSLSWAQNSSAGYDMMQITFAVAPATVPAPATGLALLLPAAFAGRRRR